MVLIPALILILEEGEEGVRTSSRIVRLSRDLMVLVAVGPGDGSHNIARRIRHLRRRHRDRGLCSRSRGSGIQGFG